MIVLDSNKAFGQSITVAIKTKSVAYQEFYGHIAVYIDLTDDRNMNVINHFISFGFTHSLSAYC